ncbi:Mitochondrial antiviral-signaling protein [Merluccius polli]|uniref:Mitochondrial antiviral-signaling protein n=1 Tax=Merluccius polli TaxID=89951 RepID=A0AA47P0G2_MERPO|nr:Mitochondrial antiviral-signaling protein [Merluccius polli]
MPMIASQVKVREIVPHLPCLTPSDREEIEAKREISGNFTAMQHLLDCLRRRENWPEQFITALETCEHLTMAGEIGAEYHSLKTPSAPKLPCPTSTVVMATVHSTPSVSPSAPAACEGVPTGSSLTETTEAPGDPQSPVSFSELGARTSLPDPQNPSTPPPSPEITHLSPRVEVPAHHQEPEENSEETEELVVDVGGPGPADAVGAACDVAAETGKSHPARVHGNMAELRAEILV